MEKYIELPALDNISQSGYDDLQAVMPSFNFNGFVDEITSGKNVFDPSGILDFFVNTFAKEMYDALKILAVIIAVVIISALIENLRNSFNKSVSLNSQIVVTALLAGLAGELFFQSSTYAETVSGDITKVMWAILPVMTTLTYSSGFITAGTVTHPILFFMCNVFAEMFHKILIPLCVVYLAISLADFISDTVKLGKFRELIKKSYNFLLGLIMTFFTGLLTVGSFAGVSLDSVGAKGVKFAISNMVPFVGRSLSDAMSAVVSASLLLKNAVGITGIVCMLALCILPVIKIAVTIIAIRISAAVCEMIANEKTVQILSSVADSLSMINAAVIATVIMMIISLSIIVGIK